MTPDEEKERKCPACGGEVDRESDTGTVWYVCRSCKGVWPITPDAE